MAMHVPDPFPRCGIGSGHTRLAVYVYGYLAAFVSCVAFYEGYAETR